MFKLYFERFNVRKFLMIDSTKHLSLSEFESLGTNKNGVYHFDLSAIDIDYFDAFFLSVIFHLKF